MSSAATDPTQCARCAKTLIYLGIAEAVVFMVLKVALGMSCGSRALLAASLYSLQDLVASISALVGMTVSVRPPDVSHPYGHGKVEYLVVVLMSVLLLLGVVALMITALAGAFEPGAPAEAPSVAALWLALVCGACCWLLSARAECAATRLNSPALLSCSQHYHGDVLASAAVVVSVIGAHLGLVVLDHIVAVAEAAHIVFLSGRMLGTAINGLMDTAAAPSLVQRLRQAVGGLDTVARVRDLRARWAGQSLLARVSVEVDGRMKVAEAEALRDQIEQVIRAQRHGDRKALVHTLLVPGPRSEGRSA